MKSQRDRPDLTDAERAQIRKKRKAEKTTASQTGEWHRCMFRIPKKQRFCNMQRIHGSMYCGNHLPQDDDNIASQKSKQFAPDRRKRVPCPIDPTHTVYAYDVDRHSKICNKVREHQIATTLPYYSPNINSGDSTYHLPTDTQRPASTEKLQSAEVQKTSSEEHSKPSEQQEQNLLDRLLRIDFSDLRQRIQTAYTKCIGQSLDDVEKLSHPSCDKLLQEKHDVGAKKSAIRHIEQQASIIGHMDKSKLIQDGALYIELGAGRGMLSYALAQHVSSSHFVLVDRSPTKNKADHFITSEVNDLTRAKIDIRHLDLSGLDELQSNADKRIVCMSKHLCGVATDLSLRCLKTLPKNGDKLGGLAIALCCHHACQWEDYINPSYFLSCGFKPEEFALVRSLTSWATSAMGTEGDSVEKALQISKPERETLGRQCKRILDAGRAAYLAQKGFHTKLVHYCEREDSLENCLLLAYK